MEPPQLIPVSDFHKLAVLDLFKIQPVRVEHDGRFWAFYSRVLAEPLLSEYESGLLQAPLRDYTASLDRVKTRIFEAERAKNGARHANPHPAR